MLTRTLAATTCDLLLGQRAVAARGRAKECAALRTKERRRASQRRQGFGIGS